MEVVYPLSNIFRLFNKFSILKLAIFYNLLPLYFLPVLPFSFPSIPQQHVPWLALVLTLSLIFSHSCPKCSTLPLASCFLLDVPCLPLRLLACLSFFFKELFTLGESAINPNYYKRQSTSKYDNGTCVVASFEGNSDSRNHS